MSEIINKTSNSPIGSLDSSLYSLPQQEKRQPNKIGKDEFLQLLVVQLKHQDPLDPMKDEQFAVNLAQFSQLEQLIAINDKMGEGDLSSLATYLGHQVTLNSDKIAVRHKEGGRVSFNLDRDSTAVKVELLDAQDRVVTTKELGEFAAGKHLVSLEQLEVNDGEYRIRVVARGTAGEERQVQGFAAGIVNGFVPGPEAVLLVDGREVKPASIREVSVANSGR